MAILTVDGVLCVELVAILAVCLTSFPGGCSIASKDVYTLSNGFYMVEVYTEPDTAKMIYLETIRNKAYAELVGPPMDANIRPLLTVPKCSIPLRVY